MTSTSYDAVFDKFIGSVTDFDLTSMDTSDAYSLMTEYLHKALSETYLRRLFETVGLDDDVQVLTFTLKILTEDEGDLEFVTSAIAKWMVYEWLHNQVNSKTNTMQLLAGKEQKFYSQSNHIAELRALQDDALKEARLFITDRGITYNSYLGGA